ncbi:hypothetical protein DPMN_179103 [Dreissena polymorpha]|uniref:Uncharacterized protein n=1 Tax=Dreissena polymorpha TaxID=45954 RepID=A0A9D4EDY9_DREPO|nr:hypothetical protein DPMN_179103 [Dreissena polymorpha]
MLKAKIETEMPNHKMEMQRLLSVDSVNLISDGKDVLTLAKIEGITDIGEAVELAEKYEVYINDVTCVSEIKERLIMHLKRQYMSNRKKEVIHLKILQCLIK